MHELRRKEIDDRRVCLVAQAGDYYAVRIAVRGPEQWEDISLRADQDLAFDVASRRYSKSTMVVKSCQKVYISHMSKPAMDKRNRYADT